MISNVSKLVQSVLSQVIQIYLSTQILHKGHGIFSHIPSFYHE